MPNPLNLVTSTLATTLRAGIGIGSLGAAQQPNPALRLYDIENCPFCRLAREALTELDLDVEILPCPKGGTRFRPEAVELGGKAQFPYLIDEGAGVKMYESMDIVAYLYTVYGQRELPLKWRLGSLQTVSSSLASGMRINRGMRAIASRPPQQMLELFSFEGSPYARLVRELLCQMEIPYIVRNCGRGEAAAWLLPPIRERLGIELRGSVANRRVLQEREGRVAIPYLHDPNNGTRLFESDQIISYLQAEYAA